MPIHLAQKEKKPITEKRLEANRRNARKSKGPVSARGRVVSAQNARKYQPLPFEKPTLPAQLTAQYYGKFIPANRTERRLVDTLVHAKRIRRCCLDLETRILTEETSGVELRSMAEALTVASRRLMTVPYQMDVAQCAYLNALRQLETIRSKAA